VPRKVSVIGLGLSSRTQVRILNFKSRIKRFLVRRRVESNWPSFLTDSQGYARSLCATWIANHWALPDSIGIAVQKFNNNRGWVSFVRNLRWLIACMLFLATVINYLDRQILSVVAPVLRRELSLTNVEYSYAVNSFMIAYAITYMVMGRAIDLLGTRHGVGVSFAAWSLASFAHTFIHRLRDLCIYRFLLGVAEPGIFPASMKAVSAWFPAKERGVAIGFVFGGAAIAAIIAPPVVVWLTLAYGWRMAFALTSLVGMIWLLFWSAIYREPADHSWITQQELSHIQSADTDAILPQQGRRMSLAQLLKFPQTWSFILARFFADSLGYFNMYWIPSYLVSNKGFSFQLMGGLLWIPFLLQDFGGIAGGYCSGLLVTRNVAPIMSRKLTMSLSLFLIPLGIGAVLASRPSHVIFYLCLATFGLGWWSTNLHSLMMDSFPSHSIGSVAGFSGTAGALGGIAFTWFTGYASDHNGYEEVFGTTAILISLSLAATWVLLRKPVKLDAVSQNSLDLEEKSGALP
jgi:ACS family hexuronate transporter-like MFS transporter